MSTRIDVALLRNKYNQAWEQAKAIVTDSRYELGYKVAQARTILSAALTDIEESGKIALPLMNEREAQLQAKLRTNYVPSVNEIAQLTYTRDALQTRWQSASPEELREDWAAAVSAHDLITARVYRDFVEPVVQRKIGATADSSLPAWYNELHQQTDNLLLSPEQRQAKAELEKLQQERIEIREVISESKIKLGGAQVTQDNELLDGAQIQQWAIARF